MKINLPLETWVDVFMYLSRLQLMQLIPHHIDTRPKRRVRRTYNPTTIGDRQFVSFIQFYLHKCGEITLGSLEIQKYPKNGPPIVKVYKNHPVGRRMPLADVPISQNIKNFEKIDLTCFDESVLRFLQEFQHNSLLTKIYLCVNKNHNRTVDSLTLVGIMANFMTLFTRIDLITIYEIFPESADIQRLFQSNEYSMLAMRMLKSTRFLTIQHCLNPEWYLDWLYTPTDDGQPRYLRLHTYFGERICPPFVERVKKDFLEAKETAISFFIQLTFGDSPNVQSVTLDNGLTKEKLVITSEGGITIARHPIGANEKWIEEINKEFWLKYVNRKPVLTIHI